MADCSYIQRLLPPLDYEQQLEEISNMLNLGRFSGRLYEVEGWALGYS
jgi:hypothetical protein